MAPGKQLKLPSLRGETFAGALGDKSPVGVC